MPWHWHVDVERRFSFAILQKNFTYYHRDRYVRKSTVHQSGLTPLRAQISSDGLVYCRIYPLASLYPLPLLTISTDKSRPRKKNRVSPSRYACSTRHMGISGPVAVDSRCELSTAPCKHSHVAQRNMWFGELDNTDTSDRTGRSQPSFLSRHKGKIRRTSPEKAGKFIDQQRHDG